MLKKTIVITGATSGIGTETALELALQGHHIYMLVRDLNKGMIMKRTLLVQAHNKNVHVIECDLASMASVKKAADQLKAQLSAIDVLINNAGGIFPEREVSVDGFEMTLATDHLGPFLLTLSLMPLLEKGNARIINVSSDAHKAAKPDMNDLQAERSYSSIRAYGNAKLFNIYFTRSLAEKYAGKGITAYSLHPGVVNTKFGDAYTGFARWVLNMIRPMMIDPREGAATTVYLAEEPGLEKYNGGYFKKKQPTEPAAIAKNADNQKKIWEKSELLVKAFL